MTYDELNKEAKKNDVNFENVTRLWYSDVTEGNLRCCHNENCVYMIECNGEIVYIGSTTNLPYRLTNHKYRLSFDCVYVGFVEGDLRTMLFLEYLLIGIAEPSLNFTDYTSTTFKSKNYNYILQNIHCNCI